MNLVTFVLVILHRYEVYSQQGELDCINCVSVTAGRCFLCVICDLKPVFNNAVGIANCIAVAGMNGRVRDVYCVRLIHVYNLCSSHYMVCWLTVAWKSLFVNKRRYRLY